MVSQGDNQEPLDPWQLLREMPGNIFWMDRRGTYLGCNTSLSKVLGFSSPWSIVGKTHGDFLSDEMAKEVDSINEDVMSRNTPLVIEEKGLDVDSNPAIFLSHKIPLTNSKNEVIGLMGVSLDITEKKQLEASLREAKEQAEEANRSKSEFIGNMSHDLRTPITGIVSVAEMIQNKTEEPLTKKCAGMLFSAGQLLAKFMDRILAYCQAEHPESKLEQTSQFNFKQLVDEVESMILPAVMAKKLNFSVDYDTDIPEQLIGPSQGCYQVMLNLVSNAVKFTKEGRVRLKVSRLQQQGDEIVLGIRVEDTGIGIAKEKQESVFEAFSRISPSYEEKHKGVGLGLFLVRQHLKQMGGSVRLESELGEGTVFICRMPLHVALAEECA